MAATPKTFEIYELKPGPADVELVSVKDHVGLKSGNPGWKWTFREIRTGETFDIYTMFSTAARWKLTETLNAFGWESEDGLNEVDPNLYVGLVVTGDFDFQQEDEFSSGMGGPQYLELKRVHRKITEDDLPPAPSIREYQEQAAAAAEFSEERDGAKF